MQVMPDCGRNQKCGRSHALPPERLGRRRWGGLRDSGREKPFQPLEQQARISGVLCFFAYNACFWLALVSRFGVPAVLAGRMLPRPFFVCR